LVLNFGLEKIKASRGGAEDEEKRKLSISVQQLAANLQHFCCFAQCFVQFGNIFTASAGVVGLAASPAPHERSDGLENFAGGQLFGEVG
jgi:hypothetical protein